jgi:hypothetical protein
MELSWLEVKQAFRQVLAEELGYGKCTIAPKWEDGTLVLKPADPNKQSKEVPLDVFFKKMTSVRERLRVLEQRINNHDSLSNAEKAELQQYITRCYGSLTTFNVLFREEEDKFHGSGGE